MKAHTLIAFIATAIGAYVLGRSGIPAESLSPAAAALPQAAPAAPGGRLGHLDRLAGVWEGSFHWAMSPNMPPMELAARIERDWILGGRFLMEKVVSESPVLPFEGLGVYGYNEIAKRYEVFWIDNMHSDLMWSQGAYDPEGDVLKLVSEHHDPLAGGTVFHRSSADLSDPDRHVFSGTAVWPDGREFDEYEGVFERVE